MRGRKTGGRVAGTPNKTTADLKNMIVGALIGVGGQQYLERQAEQNPAAFLSLVGKVLPTELKSDPNGGTIVLITGVRRELEPPTIEATAVDGDTLSVNTGIRRYNGNGHDTEED